MKTLQDLQDLINAIKEENSDFDLDEIPLLMDGKELNELDIECYGGDLSRLYVDITIV